MIRDIKIKEKAREYAIPETTIEKDYALNWILKSLYQQTDSFALKGGTGLRKEDFQNAWKSSLKHQLRVLPEFETVFSDVIYLMQKLL